MIRTTPFHDRTSAANVSGLWEHWSGYLVAQKYQLSEKFEYFAIRNSAGLFDSSPLYKYRIHGPDAEAFLAGVLARDIRSCPVGHGQYTAWLDDRGFVVEDGVVFRTAPDDYLMTCAEPNLAYFEALIGRHRVSIDDVSEDSAVLSIQGPRSREILGSIAPQVCDLPYFGLTTVTIAGTRIMVSRTGYTGDLGFELWIPSERAVAVWDAVSDAAKGQGVIPFGMVALYMARIEAGLLLLDVDFGSSRYAWTDASRSSLIELGLGRLVSFDKGDFVGRLALEREQRAGGPARRLVGLQLDWYDIEGLYDAQGLPPAISPSVDRSPVPVFAGGRQVGRATSHGWSPILKQAIALASVPPQYEPVGSSLSVEWTVEGRRGRVGATVVPLPFLDLPRKRS